MAGFNNRDDEIISTINVTPLVDIMLVLLIIFMLVSTFVVKESIEVDLPHAAKGSEVEAQTLSISLSKKGDYFLAGKKMENYDELADKLIARKKKTPSIQVVISADKKVHHGAVINVIDLVRKIGIFKFAINIEYINHADKR